MHSSNNHPHRGATAIWIAVTLVILVGIIFIATRSAAKSPELSTQASGDNTAAGSTPPAASSTLPGINTGMVPWPVELDNLKARLTADSLPALSAEGTVLHIHQHLDIYVDGQNVPVPAGIGINEAQQFISPIHVHDTTGIIHVESPTPGTFTLGEFFDIWGVRLTDLCLGGYCTSEGKSLRMYVNGQFYQGDPRAIVLASHQEIAIVFGTSAEIPKPVPASYTFPQGY